MRQRWNHVTFLHWPVDTDVVQSRLPAGLTADTFEGRAWVGLVPFEMVDITIRGRSVPYLGTFPETNIRTYVIGPDGAPGVWFDSLDASRLIPVMVARLGYGLPYRWAKMRLEASGDVVRYQSRRRSGTTAVNRVAVSIREPIPSPAPLSKFLTDRDRLYALHRGALLRALVAHPPWPLHRAEILELDPGPLLAAGYPRQTEPPRVLYSPGVPVAVSKPEPAV